MKFESYGDSVDQNFSQFNENLIKNQEPQSQIEKDETTVAEYPNESDREEVQTNRTTALPDFLPQILLDDKIAQGINSLNSRQREVFNTVQR